MLCGCLLLTSVPIARIGRRIEEGCLFYKSWVQRWIGGISVTAKIRNDVPSSEKEKEEKTGKKKKKKKDCLFSLAEAVSQGFVGENYARRASFSRGKRRSRLTLTGRRRQATFAVFLFLSIHTKCPPCQMCQREHKNIKN